MQKYLRLFGANRLNIRESFNRPKFAYTAPVSTVQTNQCRRNTGKHKSFAVLIQWIKENVQNYDVLFFVISQIDEWAASSINIQWIELNL